MRAAPGAKIPPTTKYQTAWVKKIDSGMKKETRIHEIAADKLIEIKEPVMAFEVARPLGSRRGKSQRRERPGGQNTHPSSTILLKKNPASSLVFE